MAFNVGELEATLQLDTSKWESGIARAGGKFDSFIAGMAGGATFAAINALQDALGAVTDRIADNVGAGLQYNATLEQVTAKINELAGSEENAARVMALVKQEAEATRTPLLEMADATGQLIPLARQSGESLNDLLSVAQLLAASNMEQGFDGAAVALREFVSSGGKDLISLAERFNMNKNAIRELMAQGVPALEAVRQELERMGYSADFVASQADTGKRRFAALFDLFAQVRGTALSGPFEALSEAAGEALETIDRNRPEIEAFAAQLSEKLGDATREALALAEDVDWRGVADSVLVIADIVARIPDKIREAIELIRPLIELYQKVDAATRGIPSPASVGQEVGKRLRSFIDDIRGVDQAASQAAGGGLSTFGAAQDAVAASTSEASEAITFQRRTIGGFIQDVASAAMGVKESATASAEALAGRLVPAYREAVEASKQYATESARHRQQAQEQERDYVRTVAKLQGEIAEAQNETAARRREIESQLVQDLAQAEQEHAATVEDVQEDIAAAARDAAAAREKAAQELADKLATLERNHTRKIDDLQRDLNRRIDDYESERERARTDHLDKLAKLEEQHADRYSDIQGRMSDLVFDLQEKRLKREQDVQDKIDRLRERSLEKQKGIQDEIDTIMGSIPARTLRRYKTAIARGLIKPEDLLGKDQQARLKELREQLAEEQGELDKATQEVIDRAKQEEDAETRKHTRAMDALRERLAEEKERYEKAVQEAKDRYEQDRENRQRAHERAVEDLERRINRENEDYERQTQELEARNAAELADIADKHNAAVSELEARLTAENAAYDAQRQKLEQDAQRAHEALQSRLAERVAAVQERLADEAYAHEQAQYKIRLAQWETEQAMRDAQQRIADAMAGPRSQVQELLYWFDQLKAWGDTNTVTIRVQADIDEMLQRHSPSPLEQELANILAMRNELNRSPLRVAMQSVGLAALPAPAAAGPRAPLAGGANINVQAYYPYERPASLMDDIRFYDARVRAT